MQRIIFLLLFIFSSTNIFSQVYPNWSEHLPYRKATKLEATKTKVYCLTESGLFSYSLNDNEIIAYNKSNGLTDTKITTIGVASWNNCMIIGYENGNIDLIKNGKINNISDIARFSDITNKTIRSITASNKKAYLGTDFGVVILNIDKNEVSETCYIGHNGEKIGVNHIAIFNNYIWAATQTGIYRAAANAFNLADYNSWKLVKNIDNPYNSYNQFKEVNNNFYLLHSNNSNSTIYQLKTDNWLRIYNISEKVYNMIHYNNQLCVVTNSNATTLSGTSVLPVTVPNKAALRDIIQTKNQTFVADNNSAMLQIANGNITNIRPDGPLNNNITTICSSNSAIWAASGVQQPTTNAASLYRYIDNRWENFTYQNTPELNEKHNIIAIESDKIDKNKLYAALWNQGIIVFKDGKYKNLIDASTAPVKLDKIAAITTDNKGNLWLLNKNDNKPIKVLTPQNSWTTLGYSDLGTDNFKKIIALSNGDKWILQNSGSRIFALNENGTIGNNDDDVAKSFVIADKNSNVIGNQVNDAIQDTDGEVWAATSKGVAVYTNPGAILRKGSFFAYRPVITIDGTTQYLLSTENILSIALNGANQKWLGTENSGAYLIADTGDKQLLHFNIENSPLPSNKIEQIAVNPKTGEVFFVTNKGMVSYKGKVTAGADDYNNLYAYPNPVRETYNGDITVTGLMKNSTIRITDVSGNLVASGKSEGGQFLWNGKNLNGNRVNTGVYLIFCADNTGDKAKVIKLLVIN